MSVTSTKKKNKKGLGVTASQKSVKDFLPVLKEVVPIVGVQSGQDEWLNDTIEIMKTVNDLEREHRLSLANTFKLGWAEQRLKSKQSPVVAKRGVGRPENVSISIPISKKPKENIHCSNQNQNWRQKLQKFRVDPIDNSGE